MNLAPSKARRLLPGESPGRVRDRDKRGFLGREPILVGATLNDISAAIIIMSPPQAVDN
jgi:hypothetical protein